MSGDSELESFKRIDLRAYAASVGYQLDKRESWRGSSVMRHSNGDKIVINRGADGHCVYFSVRDDDDNGSIIDFVGRRDRVSLGVVRKILRQWIGLPPVPVPTFPPLHATNKDRLRVQTTFAKMQDAPHHPYLEWERALPAALLGSERLAGRIRIDARGNASSLISMARACAGTKSRTRDSPASLLAEVRACGSRMNCPTTTGWCSVRVRLMPCRMRWCFPIQIIGPATPRLAANRTRHNRNSYVRQPHDCLPVVK